MSPPSAAKTSKTSSKPGRTSSHTYFSRLSKRFFKSSARPDSIDPQSPPSKLTPPKPTQRLCSLKRKSNKYFATQARKLLASPDSEVSDANHADADSNTDRQIETMHQDAMGDQTSTPTPVPVLLARSLNTSTFQSAEETARFTGTSTNSDPINFVSVEIFPNQLTPTRTKRPLPPPMSRHAVREEAKRVREIIDLIDDGEDDTPATKKLKIGTQLESPQAVGFPFSSSKRSHIPREELRDSAAEQRMLLDAVENANGDSRGSTGNDVRSGEAGAEDTKRTPTTAEKKKKKLFGTLGGNGLAVRAGQHVAAAAKGAVASGDVPCSHTNRPGGLHSQSESSAPKSANGASQQTNGHRQKTFQDQTDSIFVDEGYGSFSVPDDDDDDRVPENEDELMKRINGSLGLLSPFVVQNDRKKVNKLVSPEQAYAEKQRERDVERSRRMREANLAAQKQKSKVTANGSGGGLSVGFLEDMEARKNGEESGLTQGESRDVGNARREDQKERLAVVNGDRLTLSNGNHVHHQKKTVDARKPSTTNQRQEIMTYTALLDIAENYVRSTGPNGSVQATQRSSASAKPSEKLAADFQAVGSQNEDVTRTGFIQLLEQQLSNGGRGAKKTAGASGLEGRKSIISQLTPKRKKRQNVSTTQTTSTVEQQGTYDKQLASEARLLELRNAPASGNTSSAPTTLPKLSQGGSLLDQLVKKREDHTTLSAESSTSGQESHLIEPHRRPKRARRDDVKRAKATVETAEAALLRMGLPASLFKDWRARRKWSWASREEEFKGKTEELKELVVRNSNSRVQEAEETLIRMGLLASQFEDWDNKRKYFWAKREIEFQGKTKELKELIARHPSAVASTGRKSDKRSSANVAAAEVVLRDLGLEPSVLERLSDKQKPSWAKLETELAETKERIKNFNAKQDAKEWTTSVPDSSAEKEATNHVPENDTAVPAEEVSESEESEEEEGWQYAIRWQGTEQPKTLADTMPLHPVAAKAGISLEESESEAQEDEVEEPEMHFRPGADSPTVDTPITAPGPYPNRQKPDKALLRQMERKRYNDWSDEEDEVYEYVVKAETWGMTNFPADHILILGRYLDKDNAEEMVRDFISSCKPNGMARSLEVQSVWSDGNFSQKMIRDGEAGCRAFVEPEIVSARQYPGLKAKISRRKTYAVLFERTISRIGANGELEEDRTATTVDDMQVFTTKSLANWQAKNEYHNWCKEHLRKPQDKAWLLVHDEELCKHVEELNEDGLLFSWNEPISTGSVTDTMKVWVKEIAPKGPRN
jgi:hypothetical protein